MSAFTEQHERYLALLMPELQRALSREGIPDSLRDAMRYSVLAGGKRLRPSLCMASAELAGETAEIALPFAAALELIHTYSLIHDDLPCMDNDDFRRGKPTNHKVFGEGFAVLAGDGLLSLAVEIAAEAALKLGTCGTRALYAIIHGAGVSGMVAGQSRDLENEKSPAWSEETLLSIHRGKTGALLRASVLSGAYAAGADEALLHALSRFGEAYGLLFQITDDLLDVTGDFAAMGKTLGKDAAEQKLTYVTFYGLEQAKTLAGRAADEADAALSGYRAEYFHSLVASTLSRRS